MAVAKAGRWPTLERVQERDPRIKPATLDRNSGALDPARRFWLDAKARKLVDSGTFPTLELLAAAAGAVRKSYLAKYEDALTEQRRRWVTAHGDHPTWRDEPSQDPSADPATPPEEGSGDAAATVPPELEAVATGDGLQEVAQRQIKRLLADRKANKKTIAALAGELAETKEALRRALDIIRKYHAAEVSKPSASTRS
ncbi:MAG TPA: hypothetical protein VGC35_05965 [Allosphingosinicella sp.]